MRKFFTTLLLLLTVSLSQAQTRRSETVYCQGQQNTIDLRNLNPQTLDASLMDALHTMQPARRAASANGIRWIDRIHNMPDYHLTFYQKYGTMIQEVLAGGSNALSDPDLGTYTAWTGNYAIPIVTFEGSVDFTYPADASQEIIAKKAAEAVNPICKKQWDDANCFMIFLCIALSYDYPEGFWLDSYYRWANRYQYNFNYSYTGTTGTAHYTQYIELVVKTDGFDHRRTEFQDPQVLAEAVTEYKDRVQSILANCPTGWWNYNKIVYLNDWLTMNNSYNSDFGHTNDVAKIAWSPLSALRGSTGKKGPVCEAYARAFKVLCDQTGIPCILATGFARGSRAENGESHMWNEVQMQDGNWYAVDVTWNDPLDPQNRKVSGYESKKWMLLGSEDIVAPDFTFAQSHPFGIVWETDPDYVQQWDYSVESFITTHQYDAAAGIGKSPTITRPDPGAYSLGGQYLGKQPSPHRNGTPQIIINNGRKMLVK